MHAVSDVCHLLHIGPVKVRQLYFYLLFHNYFISDCGTPLESGYEFNGTIATTYQSTSSVACATGFDGTASPTTVTCEATGDWTGVSGCIIKGIVISYKICTYCFLNR